MGRVSRPAGRPDGWSAPVCVQLAGGSFGFQIGGQATDLVLIAMNDQGLQDMLKNKFKLGADAAASAGPVGRNAQAGTDWKMNAEFLTYSRSKGLFAGIDLDGTVLSQNQDDTRAMYGADIPFDTILKGDAGNAGGGAAFVRTVAKYFVMVKEAQLRTKLVGQDADEGTACGLSLSFLGVKASESVD